MQSKPIYIIVTPFFPRPGSWRGAYCYDFARTLMREGAYDVRVFVPGRGADYVYQGVQVYQFDHRMLPSAVLPFLFSRRNQRAFLVKVAAVGIDLKTVKVVHAHTAFFGIYALAVKRLNPSCLTLLHHHDMGSFGLNIGRLCCFYPHKLINFFLLRRMHEALDGHVFISQCVKRSFLAAPDASWTTYPFYRKQMAGLGVFRSARIKRSFVLHNGVDVSQFNTEGRVAHEGFVIGCIANFMELKDLPSLLLAVAQIRDQLGSWKLRMIGSGPTLKACKRLVQQEGLGAQVSFESEVDHTQLPNFYRSLDLFVLPSYFEGFGCVFTESHACGTPFITCEGQGMDDLLTSSEQRNLWLCKQRSPADLAAKILNVYQQRPKQRLTGEIAIDPLVKNFLAEISNVEQ